LCHEQGHWHKKCPKKKKVEVNVKEMEINEVIAYAFLTNISKDKKGYVMNHITKLW
jgi:hypothetical protein